MPLARFCPEFAFPGNSITRGIDAPKFVFGRKLALLMLVAMLAGCSSATGGVAVRLPATEPFDRTTDSGWHCLRDVGEVEFRCEGEVAQPTEGESEALAIATPTMGGTPTDGDLMDRLPELALVVPITPEADDTAHELERKATERPSPEIKAIVDAFIRAGDYTVQVIALASMEAVRAFAADNAIDDQLIVQIVTENRVSFGLLLGFYPDRLAAEEAISKLPEELQSLSPWVRSSNSLREAMARAQTLIEASANLDSN